MITYTLRIKDPAEEWLKKYDKNIQQKFANKIRKLKENPELHGKPLRKPLHGIR
jgi:mRNA-degrading endonuclease RelE of RelBE toxin-antitoxin system